MSVVIVPDIKIKIKNLYKVFGKNPDLAMKNVRSGKPKEQILSEYGQTLALKNINLEIQMGSVFVIMGLSGAGKSTLVRHINRLIEPTEGEIKVDDTNVLSLNQRELANFRREKMSMVFQRFGLMPHRTVIENVAYGLTIQKVPRTKREKTAKEWLLSVGLGGYENQYPSQLSGGEQQRVGLARALCTDPEILLMDEAFSALDPLIRSDMQEQLISLQKKLNKTIVFITHDLNEAIRIGDKIAILKDGEVSQVGAPEEILLNPADEYVKAFVREFNRTKTSRVKI